MEAVLVYPETGRTVDLTKRFAEVFGEYTS